MPLNISIHSLRVEGDDNVFNAINKRLQISIHSLRVEGDMQNLLVYGDINISIHSLRVEGDIVLLSYLRSCIYNFNPLPPCGGRLLSSFRLVHCATFQSTPSVWRETVET